jgi:hypothetical protein
VVHREETTRLVEPREVLYVFAFPGLVGGMKSESNANGTALASMMISLPVASPASDG